MILRLGFLNMGQIQGILQPVGSPNHKSKSALSVLFYRIIALKVQQTLKTQSASAFYVEKGRCKIQTATASEAQKVRKEPYHLFPLALLRKKVSFSVENDQRRRLWKPPLF